MRPLVRAAMAPTIPSSTRLAQGDPQAFAEFYDGHARTLLAVARAVTGSTADAEDAVQQTFVDLYRARVRFAAGIDPRAYAIRALHRNAVRARERSRRMETLHEHGEPVDRDRRSPDGDERLAHELQALTPEHREVIALKLDGDLTFVEIGVTLGIPPDTAASRYRRALEKLRERMGGPR